MKNISGSRIALSLCVASLYIFLYIPIVVLIIFSFNNAVFPAPWAGFTLKWYKEFFYSEPLWDALKNSTIVALSSTTISCILGLFVVFYLAQTRKIERTLILFYANIMVPEIVLAVALLTFFSYCSVPLGLFTLIAAHTLLGLGYVIPILHARFNELDKTLLEASLDLGASRTQTFFKIIVPFLIPSLSAAALLVFIISFDDFLFAFFCAGSSVTTLSLYIFSMLRAGVSPIVNALSTVLFVLSSILVLFFCLLNKRIRII